MQGPPPDKNLLHQVWCAHLEAKAAQLREGQARAREGTRVDGEHRPSNRGERAAVTNQGYLAHGIGQRIADVKASLQLLARVGTEPREQIIVGALAALRLEDDSIRWLAVLPGGDASNHVIGDTSVQVLSTQAPLVRELTGLEIGDVAEVSIGNATMGIEIIVIL